MTPRPFLSQRPSTAVAWLLAALLVAAYAVARLVLFTDFLLPLTFVLPLLVCTWTRHRISLWTMAAAFVVLATVEFFRLLPPTAMPAHAVWPAYLATLVNVVVGASAIHLVISLRDRLESAVAQARAAEAQVRRQADQLAAQNSELNAQSEELATQNEELAQQNEELQVQGEEMAALNVDLERRERLLHNMIAAARLGWSERQVLDRICATAMELFEGCDAVLVEERRGESLVVRGAAGIGEHQGRSVPVAGGFAAIAIEQQRTAALNDTCLRPDLATQRLGDTPVGSILCAPLVSGGAALGTLSICGRSAHEWTDEEFRLADWLAGQCAIALEMLRLHDGLQRRATLVDLSPDAIIVRRPDDVVTLWSAGAAALYGFSAEQAIGRRLEDLLQTRWPEPRAHIEDRLRETGRWSGELVQVTSSGREVVIASRWQAERDASGAVVDILESNVDVTARAHAERAVREADRRKFEFLATLSHELRNPLAAMRYALDLLGRGADDRARPRQVMERQLTHLVRLVDDLLDITRLGSNKFQLRVERVSLAGVINQAVEAASPEIQRYSHELHVDAPPASMVLDGDRDRLAQVITNLLNNAARYTPAGGRITLSTVQADGHVSISVSDNGVGLAEDERARVFEMFTQMGTQSAHGGLGIGLALVKAVVQLHGGHVEARSAGKGHGSTFVVTLPLAVAFGDAPADAATAAVPARTRRILVVDDNADAAEMMRAVLDFDGHDVRVAHSAARALDAAAEFLPDIALLDIGLPDMDGYELAMRLREHPATRRTCLVAVTGWGQEDDRRRARASGFHAHVTKPADITELSRLIAGLPVENAPSDLA